MSFKVSDLPPATHPSTMLVRRQLAAIPQGSAYRANRYDTDDQHVLKVWDEQGHSFDLRVPRTLTEADRQPLPFTSLEKLLLAVDARLLADGADPNDPLRAGIGEALKIENRRLLTEAALAAALAPHPEKE